VRREAGDLSVVDFSPVRAWHPNPEVADPDRLVCPVYDTLSDKELTEFAARPFNAARFVPRPKGVPLNQFLLASVGRLGEALAARAFVQDDQPAFYVYGISYIPPPDILETIEPDQRRARYLLLGLVGALDFGRIGHGQVAMHELTFADRVEERAALTEATGMTFAPIMAGYHLPDHGLNDWIERRLGLHRRSLAFRGTVPPITEAVLNGTTHRLWRIDAREEIEELQSRLQDLRLLILDGHHRFTAAAHRYHSGKPTAPLTMLVEGQDRALQLLPWHRALATSIASREAVESAVRAEFPEVVTVEGRPSVSLTIDRLRHMHRYHHRGFLLVGEDRLLEVRGPASDDVGADFDVLHGFLEHRLGIDPEDLEFVRSPRLALDRILDPGSSTHHGTAFLLPGLTEKGIEERAFGRGMVMAHKSTMFQPKVAEGMLFAPAGGVGESSE
jgi:uncharacterized protein (DUF1015 family)